MNRLTEPQGVKGALLRNPKIWQTALCVAIMAVIAICFFHPDSFQGNELRQYDMMQGAAIGQEAKAYHEATGETTWWTNSLFGGMPMFQISPTYSSNALFSWLTKVYGLGLPSPSNLLFMMMFGFFILMLAMNVKWQYGLIGAVAWGFSTYFIIIIGAGHIWKFVTLSYIPPTIAGIIMCYRGRRIAGAGVAALFAMMQISSNHIQMSYYFMFVILGVVIAYAIEAAKSKKLRQWAVSTLALCGAAALAVGANLPSLYYTYEYSKSTMRGGHSELTTGAADASVKSDGLDRDYITQYSYGRSETFSLMIPNIKGGASVHPVGGRNESMTLADLPEAKEAQENGILDRMTAQYLNYVSQYFGEPEGTSGPVYVGVIIFALFLVGCVIVRGPLKWALLTLTLLSVLLALGRNCMWLTDFFIDYIPMYSKFRTVESILVVAEFTIPVLAILALQKMLTDPDRKKYTVITLICFGVVCFIALLGMALPAIFGGVVNETDEQTSNMIVYQLMSQGYPANEAQLFSLDNPTIYDAIRQLREGMVRADSLRSFFFALMACGFIIFGLQGKGKKNIIACAAVGLLIFIDLYTVNKRYLNHDSFCTPELSVADPFEPTVLDHYLHSDTTMNYRVMNVPAFNSPVPSYHHKMIGGYHAAKLTRYQDLIDRHLSHFLTGDVTEADLQVLNMLNARYLIDTQGQPLTNPAAFGNAWFVDTLLTVDGADAEMDALSRFDLSKTAVADKRFANILKAASEVQPGDTIFETSYAPNRLTYHANTARGGTAVFSEVYFPWGWKAEIDGTPVEIGRVNYLLRAIDIPAGAHTVTMTFDPDSMHATTATATVAVILIYLLVLTGVVLTIMKYPRKE